jgi:hypothetical protein
MRVMPPKEGPSRTGISAMRFSAHGFFVLTTDYTDEHGYETAEFRADNESGKQELRKRLLFSF